MSCDEDFLVNLRPQGQTVLSAIGTAPVCIVSRVLFLREIIEHQEKGAVPIRHIFVEEGLLHSRMVVFNSDKEESVICIDIASCFLVLVSPEIATITPVAMGGFGAPWVSHFNETDMIIQLNELEHSVGVTLGETKAVLHLIIS